MKFATFISGGQEYAGIYHDGYYSFKDLLGGRVSETLTLLEFIRSCESKDLLEFIEVIPEIISQNNLKPAASPTLRPPIPWPFRDIICLGKNYADHAKEMSASSANASSANASSANASSVPQAPVYFAKTAFPTLGDGDKIPSHSQLTNQLDYEAELAVIIGKTTRYIPTSEVEKIIFGYTILNDITARDLQAKHGQWFYGKSLDGACPMGPVIVSRDEIPFPVNLEITSRVNGETRQHSNTSELIFDIPRIISELSMGMTLYPGDIIATGTPAGVGHAMKPPQYLKPGDKIECEIEKIGILTNFIGQ